MDILEKPTGAEHIDPETLKVIYDVERQFAALLAKARVLIKDRAESIHPELQPLGYKVLSCLQAKGPLHQGSIAATLRIDKSVMSRTIKHLEDLELVSRTPDPQDARAMLVNLIVSEQMRMQLAGQATRWTMLAKLAEWGPSDLNHLAALLTKLNETTD